MGLALTEEQARKALELVREEERSLRLRSFDEAVAYDLGTWLHNSAQKRNAPIIIDIRAGEVPLYCSALPGSSAANWDWARRKRNLVQLLGKSSWQIALETHLAKTSGSGDNPIESMALDPRDYTPHGGCFPVRIGYSDLTVATITVSGLPQAEDHSLVVRALRASSELAVFD